MPPVDTFSGAYTNIFTYLARITFTWVPATVVSVSSNVPGVNQPATILSGPVTAADYINYLQQASAPEYSSFFVNWGIFVAVMLIITFILAGFIVYCASRIMEIRRRESQKFQIVAHPVAAHDVPRTQLRWNRLMEEATTPDDRRWRIAILEADIMLNELLDLLGYKGETMGDKMKQVERADFHTIDLAWEAHRTRNRIAHEGDAHLLNEREVRRVMSSYEQVFREFKLIE
ncbi:MAG TPA: hypothetical protein VMU25_00955 [Candidatus Paceibacterota bacterium]|nr:hypothetical protein [Candidatus Paceibacterota bacterium]